PDVRIFPLVADPTVSVTPDGTTQGLKPVSLHDALPIYEAFAVAGVADRRGCKDMHLPYLHEAGHEREALDCGQRPLNVLLCQLAAFRDAPAERAGRFLVVERRQGPCVALIDYEANRVGAEDPKST